jgi:hypothetical protein
MSFNSYCETQETPAQENTPPPAPSSGSPAGTPCVDSGSPLVQAGDVSPTVNVNPAVNAGDVNVELADTADVLTGGTLAGGVQDVSDIVVGDVLNDADVIDAVTDVDIGDVLNDTADLDLDALNGGSGSSGGSGGSGSGDSDTGGLICQLVGSLGGGDGVSDIDLSDIGAILGDGCLPDLPVDGLADCFLGQSSLLDVADLGGILGDHG